MKVFAYILIIVGLIVSLNSGYTFVTKEKVIDLGPVEVNKEEKHSLPWSPVLGGIMLVSGIVILVIGKKKR